MAERQLEQLADTGRIDDIDVLSLALLRKDADALERLEQLAVEGLRREDDALIELAYAVLDRLPAIGILLARAALDPARILDSVTLLEDIERARDRLDLPPGDSSAAIFDELAMTSTHHDDEPEEDVSRLEQEVEVLRQRMDESKQRMAEYQRNLREQEEKLAQARRAFAPAPIAAVEPEEVRRLRLKVAELKGQIANGNRERAELRHELAHAASEAPPVAAQGRDVADHEDVGDAVAAPRVALVPNFAPATAEMLTLPGRIVRAVVERVAAAAAGDEGTWRQVKQMHDIAPPLFSLRVGIHHRALMRIENQALVLLDVVTRENLDTVLKRYRG